MKGVPASLNAAASTSTVVVMEEYPEYFLLLPPPWQNSSRFPTARGCHADS
jgi:hypothetical protein